MVNEASWDRVGRVVLGIALVLVGFVVLGGTAGTVVGIVGLVPLLTGLIGWCPLYAVLGIRTNRTASGAARDR